MKSTLSRRVSVWAALGGDCSFRSHAEARLAPNPCRAIPSLPRRPSSFASRRMTRYTSRSRSPRWGRACAPRWRCSWPRSSTRTGRRFVRKPRRTTRSWGVRAQVEAAPSSTRTRAFALPARRCGRCSSPPRHSSSARQEPRHRGVNEAGSVLGGPPRITVPMLGSASPRVARPMIKGWILQDIVHRAGNTALDVRRAGCCSRQSARDVLTVKCSTRARRSKGRREAGGVGVQEIGGTGVTPALPSRPTPRAAMQEMPGAEGDVGSGPHGNSTSYAFMRDRVEAAGRWSIESATPTACWRRPPKLSVRTTSFRSSHATWSRRTARQFAAA